jgi:hypothetical protein
MNVVHADTSVHNLAMYTLGHSADNFPSDPTYIDPRLLQHQTYDHVTQLKETMGPWESFSAEQHTFLGGLQQHNMDNEDCNEQGSPEPTRGESDDMSMSVTADTDYDSFIADDQYRDEKGKDIAYDDWELTDY